MTRIDGKIQMKSEFHPELAAKASNLGGKWNVDEKFWVFDERDADHIKKLYMGLYGDDGETTPILVDVRITVLVGIEAWRDAVYACGRILARARGRDSGARVGDGVKLLKGSIGSGGSMRNWRTVICPGSLFEIRDVPELAAEMEFATCNSERYVVEIFPQDTVDKHALLAEKVKLVKRLEEIEKLLNAA